MYRMWLMDLLGTLKLIHVVFHLFHQDDITLPLYHCFRFFLNRVLFVSSVMKALSTCTSTTLEDES